MILLSSQTISISTASVSDTTHINGTYSHYIWEISNLLSVSTNVAGRITLQQGGSFVAAGYYSNGFYANSGVNPSTQTNTAFFDVTNGMNGLYPTGAPAIIRFEFWNPALALPLGVIWNNSQGNGGAPSAVLGASGGFLNTNAVTTGIKLIMSSGNIATCTANLYGVT